MQDLNDLHYFAQVVRHGGFSAASRATGEPKSKLSKPVAQREQDLGVRLIERSTRSIQVNMAVQLAEGNQTIAAALAQARDLTVSVCVSVCDPYGHLIVHQRRDGAFGESSRGSI